MSNVELIISKLKNTSSAYSGCQMWWVTGNQHVKLSNHLEGHLDSECWGGGREFIQFNLKEMKQEKKKMNL